MTTHRPVYVIQGVLPVKYRAFLKAQGFVVGSRRMYISPVEFELLNQSPSFTPSEKADLHFRVKPDFISAKYLPAPLRQISVIGPSND